MTPQQPQARAEKTLHRYSLMALGAGLVPIPLVDLALLSGLQLAMIRDLARIYEVPFRKHRARHLIGALLGGGGSVSMARGLGLFTIQGNLSSLLMGVAGISALGGAVTYGLGKVFIQHFDSGGTFLDFDPQRMRDYYQQQYREGLRSLNKPSATRSHVGIKP